MHDGKLSRWHGIRSYVARVPTSLRALRSSFSNLLQTGRVPPTPDPIDAWEAQRGESLEYHRAQEKEQNQEGRLPAGESVRLPAIWVAEVYLASHIPQLIDGLEGLGWVAEWDMGTPHGLADWIQNARRRGKGAAHHTGPWVSSDRKPLMRRLGFDFSAELPEAVRAMNPQVFQPAPSSWPRSSPPAASAGGRGSGPASSSDSGTGVAPRGGSRGGAWCPQSVSHVKPSIVGS
jgi:hypothetical protein